MQPIILITAKQNSIRLPGKNMLPLGGIPLVMWSVNEAKKHNVPVIVSTDIEELKEPLKNMGCIVVHQPSTNSDGRPITHKEVIIDAVRQANMENCPVILLQPTSPFRFFDIVLKCWKEYIKNPSKTVLSISHPHMAIIENGTLNNKGCGEDLWDGNVAIYPPYRLCNYDAVVSVRNFHVNSLQIDTEQDYIEACVVLESMKGIDAVLPFSLLHVFSAAFKRGGIDGNVTLVGRMNGSPIPQDNPVVYINHCVGYDGGRCDGLFLIANEPIKQKGINKELRECAGKAKFVIVRDNGQLAWLLDNLPEIKDKFYPIRDAINPRDDHLTSGCIATSIFNSLGIKVNFIGLYEPKNIATALNTYHYPTMSREIAIFRQCNIV